MFYLIKIAIKACMHMLIQGPFVCNLGTVGFGTSKEYITTDTSALRKPVYRQIPKY